MELTRDTTTLSVLELYEAARQRSVSLFSFSLLGEIADDLPIADWITSIIAQRSRQDTCPKPTPIFPGTPTLLEYPSLSFRLFENFGHVFLLNVLWRVKDINAFPDDFFRAVPHHVRSPLVPHEYMPARIYDEHGIVAHLLHHLIAVCFVGEPGSRPRALFRLPDILRFPCHMDSCYSG